MQIEEHQFFEGRSFGIIQIRPSQVAMRLGITGHAMDHLGWAYLNYSIRLMVSVILDLSEPQRMPSSLVTCTSLPSIQTLATPGI